MRRSLTLAILIALSAAFTRSAALAADFDCFITDPQGDATVSLGEGFVGAPYEDVLRSGVSRTGTSLTFYMEVAAPIPAAPVLKNPNGLILWMWGASTGPGSPKGYPLAPGVAGALEFWVDVNWDGSAFHAQFVDRRPSLEGGTPIVTSVPFTIAGARVTVTVDASLFGDTPTFRWGSSTWAWPSHFGSTAPHKLDAAPIGASTCP